MVIARKAPPDAVVAEVDQRTYLRSVSWKHYEDLLAMRGDHSAPRIAYLYGDVEIMSPSRPHEWIKTTLARLIEAWADEMEIELDGAGSETLKSEPKERGVEPDECYLIGGHRRPMPDLAIEVVWTSGGLDKLEIYRGLGVREVWVWDKNAIQVYVLRWGRYREHPKSTVLPTLDLPLLVRCMRQPSQTLAVRALRRELRRRGHAAR
jgi:Uma2 family endonuclease